MEGETMSLKSLSLSILVMAGLVAGVAEAQGKSRKGAGDFCGGIAAIQCSAVVTGVDDPNDNCDQRAGGADCGGICAAPEKAKKPKAKGGGKCDYSDPNLSYISQSPEQCATIRFACQEG